MTVVAGLEFQMLISLISLSYNILALNQGKGRLGNVIISCSCCAFFAILYIPFVCVCGVFFFFFLLLRENVEVTLMEALFKMLTPTHSNQSVGIWGKDGHRPRKGVDNVVKRWKHGHSSFRRTGMQGDEGRRGVSLHSLPFVPSLGSLVTQDAGFWWDASAEMSFLAGSLGCLPASSA